MDNFTFHHVESLNKVMCDSLLGPGIPGYNHNASFETNASTSTAPGNRRLANTVDIVDTMEHVVVPIICMFGVIGNILILVMFARKMATCKISKVEMSSLIGLLSLAISDLCFCFVTCLGISQRYQSVAFTPGSFGYLYQLYAGVLQNIFIKSSTWLTTIVAVGRYIVVCYPIRARQATKLRYMTCAVVMSFILSGIIHIPLLYIHDVQAIYCDDGSTWLVLDSGIFQNNLLLKNCFTHLWAILGYLVPVVILGVCNAGLIRSLRQSWLLHSHMTPGSHKTSSRQDLITITTVAVVIMYVILVSPSEFLHIYDIIARPSNNRMYMIALVVTNVLQAVNFSFNFLLYALINVYLRSKLRALSRRFLPGSRAHSRQRASPNDGLVPETSPHSRHAPASESGV